MGPDGDGGMGTGEGAAEALVEGIVARADELVALALELSNLPDLAGHERAVAERAAAWWQDRGVPATVQPLSETSANVVARLGPGGSSPRLTLNAHLDTEGAVPGGDEDRVRRLRGAWREGDVLIGKGLVNDKVHVAAQMIAAAELLRQRPGGLAHGLLVVGVAQETGAPVPDAAPGRGGDPLAPPHVGEGGGCRALLGAGHRSALALVGEPNGFAISGAQAGILRLRIDLAGQVPYTPFIHRGATGSDRADTPDRLDTPNPHERAGAVVVALTRWARDLEVSRRLDFWGGTVVPKAQVQGIRSWGHPYTEERDTCHVFFDVRPPPGGRHEELVREVDDLVGRVADDYEVVVYEDLPGYVATGAAELAAAVAAGHERVFGEPPSQPSPPQVSMWQDTNAYLAAGIPALSYGVRPVGEPYTIERRRAVRVDDVVSLATVYGLTASRVCGG